MAPRMKLMMERWFTGEALGGWQILILTRKEDFLFPNHDRGRDYSSPNEYRIKVEISSFSENLNIESFLY